MTRRTAAILVFVLLAPGLHSPAEGRRSGDDRTGKYIVVLNDDVPSAAVPGLSRRIVESAKTSIPSLRRKDDTVFRHALRGFPVRLDARDLRNLDRLKDHPDVAFVAEDRPVRLHAQQFLPGMERIRVRDNALAGVNDLYDLAVDADIAVLDTGIDATHPDLSVHHSVSFVDDDPTLTDAHGHGTHVAGIVAAIDDDSGVYGVAPGARLWSVKVIDQLGGGELSDVLEGLDHVVAHADEIDVVNMSFGGSGLGDDGSCGAVSGDPLHQAVCAVVDAGVVVVVSAGNYPPYGRDASMVSPACFDEVITVSAVIETDGLGPGAGQGPPTFYGADNTFASTFSNYGFDVDIAAPGVDVASTWPGASYSTESGTSVAAPHVAGAAALWIARHGKPGNRDEVLHVRDELVRLGSPQFGAHEGFAGDLETFAEPLLNVAAIDPAVFDFVEPQLSTDKPVYVYEQDTEALVTVEVLDESGQPFDGIPGNGFAAYLGGWQRDVQLHEQGQGIYTFSLGIDGLLPGDHDLTVTVGSVAGHSGEAGCRIVVHAPAPRLLIHDMAFAFPVMNYDSYFGTNPLEAALIDEKGAPVLVSPGGFETFFSGGGPELIWFLAAPDPLTGISAGITYGVHRTEVGGIHGLPLGTYHADVTVTHDERTDSATASFDMAYPDPLLTADLSGNLSTFDFTQQIAPPPLDLTVEVDNEWGAGVAGLLYLLEEPFTLKIDGQAVPGLSFVEDLTDRGTYFVEDVPIEGLPHGTHEILVRVTDSRGLETDSDPVTIEVLRDTQACVNPLAADGQADTDGDGVRDECDNCPTVSNRSQRNTYSGNASESGLGDACKSLPRLLVSSDVRDSPDFFTIQQAVDAAPVSAMEVRIEILPGAGPYQESVVVDLGRSFLFVGVDPGSGPPVVEHAGSGNAVFEIRSAGAHPVALRNLVLRGQGIGAGQRGVLVEPGVSTRISEMKFEQLGRGLDLQSGTHHVERIVMDATVGTGVIVEGGVLTVRYGEFLGLAQAMGILGPLGVADVEHVLIAGDGVGEGIANESTLSLRHSTLVHCGIAVGGGGSTTIAHSILWDNQSDVGGVSCSEIAWSDLQDVDCGGSNRSQEPLFVDPGAGDYRLQASSPLLDHGPDPGEFTGAPCTDLDGGPRLRDHDGDGLARMDPGVYERENDAITPGDVDGLVWTGKTTLVWSPAPDAVEYHVYRAPLSTLGYDAFGFCADGLESVRTDTTLTDTGVPPGGDGFYYEITVEDAATGESTLGSGTCAERSNFSACP